MNLESDNHSIWNEVRLAYYILTDPQAPFYIRMMPFAALFYMIIPEGLIAWPLFTPLDDVAVVYLAFKGLIALAPAQLVAKYQKQLGMDILEGDFEVVENNVVENDVAEDDVVEVADKELDASIILNPDRQ